MAARRRRKPSAAEAGAQAVSQIGLRARPGSRVTLEQVADIGPVFGRLVEQGRGTAADLVMEAKDPDCPAHRHFDWDDKSAAHQHRIAQARRFIASFEIIVTDVLEPVRAFVPVTKTGSYQRIEKVLEDQDLLRALIEQAKRDAQVFLRRYERLRDIGGLKGVFDEIAKLAG